MFIYDERVTITDSPTGEVKRTVLVPAKHKVLVASAIAVSSGGGSCNIGIARWSEDSDRLQEYFIKQAVGGTGVGVSIYNFEINEETRLLFQVEGEENAKFQLTLFAEKVK